MGLRIRIGTPDPDPGGQKCPPKNGKKLEKFHVLKCWTVFRIRINFLRIRIRIQWIRMEANTDPDPIRIRIQSGSRALMTKN